MVNQDGTALDSLAVFRGIQATSVELGNSSAAARLISVCGMIFYVLQYQPPSHVSYGYPPTDKTVASEREAQPQEWGTLTIYSAVRFQKMSYEVVPVTQCFLPMPVTLSLRMSSPHGSLKSLSPVASPV